MKNYNFYQSVLFSGGSRKNREEMLRNEFPVIFKSNGHRLRDYKIYGADGGVGDYDSETGKYVIPVTIAGKNVLQNTRVGRSIAINSIINDDGSVTFSGTATARVDFYIVGAYGSTDNILSEQDTYTCSCITDTSVPDGVQFLVGYNKTTYSAVSVNTEYSLMTAQISYFAIRIPTGTTLDNVTFYPMICSSRFPDHDFEPYRTETVTICLDEPLGEGEYLHFLEQKAYPSGKIELLPVLPTFNGANILTVNTTVQPSNLYLQGNIHSVTLLSKAVLSSVPQALNLEVEMKNIDVIDDISNINESGEIQNDR